MGSTATLIVDRAARHRLRAQPRHHAAFARWLALHPDAQAQRRFLELLVGEDLVAQAHAAGVLDGEADRLLDQAEQVPVRRRTSA
jgi:hypothetical protein